MAGIAAYCAPLLGILFWLIAMAYGVTRQYPLLLSLGIYMLASGLAAPVLIWAGVRSARAHACAALRTQGWIAGAVLVYGVGTLVALKLDPPKLSGFNLASSVGEAMLFLSYLLVQAVLPLVEVVAAIYGVGVRAQR